MKIEDAHFPQETSARIRWKAPYPLIRHHFGLLTMEATLSGIAQIAKARALDIASLGIDQHTQESFSRPERYDRVRSQPRGVPARTIEDYRALYAASRRGNFPLLQTSSSTEDFLQLAALYVGTMNIAWGDTSLFWQNVMVWMRTKRFERFNPRASVGHALVWCALRTSGIERASPLGYPGRARYGFRGECLPGSL